eukprot:UN22237
MHMDDLMGLLEKSELMSDSVVKTGLNWLRLGIFVILRRNSNICFSVSSPKALYFIFIIVSYKIYYNPFWTIFEMLQTTHK